MNNLLKVGLAQIAPVWLNKEKTLEKVYQTIENAAEMGVELLVFGEGLIPGYPYWLGLTEASKWNDSMQKELYAHYVRNSIQIEAHELKTVC